AAGGGDEPERLTRSFAIDTEPVYAADGRLYFTSDRGGSAQIYRCTSPDDAERVTFEAGYAVSPAVDPAGKTLAYVVRDKGYHVAVLDLASGEQRVLTKTSGDESPCFSPNGRVIVYATENRGRGVLATVSVDGAVSTVLTGPAGDIREPTWGPLLTY
ncbi:MAG: PD40 domain-containing protein, partial [Duodenibacillus sp.]|nr:PD40 domain-containing protein [Duodenibacillus sp.]